jgi:plastocyanin
MKRFESIRFSAVFTWMLVPVVLIVPKAAKAAGAEWQASVGAQNQDAAKQAMAFLPNELWIYAGDSIAWTSKAGEGHTVTFLKQDLTGASTAGTSRPANGTTGLTGCAGDTQGGTPVTSSGLSFDGTACVNSGPMCDTSLQQTPEPGKCTSGTTYTVTFPTPGNFRFVCLIHQDMNGRVHVLPSGALPYIQADYDDIAADERRDLINDTDGVRARNDSGRSSGPKVIMAGELVATGGGKQYLAIMRFLPESIVVHVGQTVEWTNVHPTEPHTITFGVEPAAPVTQLDVTLDADGARHGTIPNSLAAPSPTCTVGTPCPNTFNSALIGAAIQDQTGQPQPTSVTRARVTFTSPGTYDYFCILHDELGMKGEVVVLP